MECSPCEYDIILTNDLLAAILCDVAIVIVQGIMKYVNCQAVVLNIARLLKIVRAPSWIWRFLQVFILILYWNKCCQRAL